MKMTFALGIDFGTNSVRALVVNTRTGEEVGTYVYDFPIVPARLNGSFTRENSGRLDPISAEPFTL